MKCPNSAAVKALGSSMDRLNEAQWYVELMQDNYHTANKFRWALTGFLRSIKEIPQIISMEVQQHAELKDWYKEVRKDIQNDPIVKYLSKQRDVVVHKKTLETASSATVGFVRGKQLKLGISVPINPRYDSVEGILMYIDAAARDTDFLGILYTEDDGSGERSAVIREWKLPGYEDVEVTTLCKHAWELMGKTNVALARMLGADFFEPQLKVKPVNEVSIQTYDPDWVKEQLQIAKSEIS
ncbi:hypothetical protein [Shewanella sp. YLB-07]|uniref:hypothetical protein n=1 Tax=Shewanella sp. YLB-07 TaxID=2601268 RepID=UPI00128BE2CE|nr:hypothetical protein [Shewanella sp. YLB-07]MPY21411.1 hypothetical protein [Shewanella sp. YLB-07]MPY22198.1 hypothetical protein [Shewanella sp. YLB-07]